MFEFLLVDYIGVSKHSKVKIVLKNIPIKLINKCLFKILKFELYFL